MPAQKAMHLPMVMSSAVVEAAARARPEVPSMIQMPESEDIGVQPAGIWVTTPERSEVYLVASSLFETNRVMALGPPPACTPFEPAAAMLH